MTAPKNGEAPSAMARSGAQENRNDADIIATLVDAIKASILAGEVVTATDYPEADRPLFSAAIAVVLDDMPSVKPTWRTINEQHVDGIRTRQKMFRIFPHQRGVIDATLAGLIALAAICIIMLSGVLA